MKYKNNTKMVKVLKKGAFLFISVLAVFILYALFGKSTENSSQVVEAQTTDEEPWSIFVVFGQSNSEGTNSYLSALPPGQELGSHPADDDTNPDDNALLWWEGADGASIQDSPTGFTDALANGGNYNPAGWMQSDYTSIDPTAAGLVNFKDLDQSDPIGQRKRQFGPELSIARELYDKGLRKIIILKVSYGFQTLAKSTSTFVPFDWYPDIPNGPDQSTRNKSYTHLLKAYNELTAHLRSKGEKFTVDGAFWQQGESDTLDTTYTYAYKENYDLLLNRVKEDLHLHPDAHFVGRKFNMRTCIDNAYPLVGTYCGFGYALRLENTTPLNILSAFSINPLISIPLNMERIRYVRDSMQEVSDKYEWADMVETDDAPFGADFIHLNAEGQLEAGKRYINMYEPPFHPRYYGLTSNLDDFDGDGIKNMNEDNGRGAGCRFTLNGIVIDNTYNESTNPEGPAGNGNLGDDDSDCDGFPDYMDSKQGKGSGLEI